MRSMLYIHTIPMNPPHYGATACAWYDQLTMLKFYSKSKIFCEMKRVNDMGFHLKDLLRWHFSALWLLDKYFTRFEKLAIMSIPVVFELTTLHSSRVNWQKESGGCSLSGFQKSLLMKHLSEAEGIDSVIVAALKLSYRTQLVCQDGHSYFWAISYELRGPLAKTIPNQINIVVFPQNHNIFLLLKNNEPNNKITIKSQSTPRVLKFWIT